jgi:hypothetical protein
MKLEQEVQEMVIRLGSRRWQGEKWRLRSFYFATTFAAYVAASSKG